MNDAIFLCLPNEVYLPPITITGELRLASKNEENLVKKWMENFYSEALSASLPPSGHESEGNELINEAHSVLYLWWDNSHPVAMGSIHNSNGRCRINLVFTPNVLRRMGYGRAVVSALINIARKNGHLPVLYVDPMNKKALRLYRSMGFVEFIH